MWRANSITDLIPVSTVTLYCSPWSIQKKCPESALPLLQPWLQRWLQHSALFSQNAPACHSFCLLLGQDSHQFPKTITKQIQMYCLSSLLSHSFYTMCCRQVFLASTAYYCVSKIRHGGNRKGEMRETSPHFLCPVPANTSLTAKVGKWIRDKAPLFSRRLPSSKSSSHNITQTNCFSNVFPWIAPVKVKSWSSKGRVFTFSFEESVGWTNFLYSTLEPLVYGESSHTTKAIFSS